MKRIAVLMLVAGLAACGSSKETSETNAEASVTAQDDAEIAGAGPSNITSIDAATGFAGGMPAETPESALPRPQDARPRPARESTADSDEPIAPEPVANLTPPVAVTTTNATVPGQPPQ